MPTQKCEDHDTDARATSERRRDRRTRFSSARPALLAAASANVRGEDRRRSARGVGWRQIHLAGEQVCDPSLGGDVRGRGRDRIRMSQVGWGNTPRIPPQVQPHPPPGGIARAQCRDGVHISGPQQQQQQDSCSTFCRGLPHYFEHYGVGVCFKFGAFKRSKDDGVDGGGTEGVPSFARTVSAARCFPWYVPPEIPTGRSDAILTSSLNNRLYAVRRRQRALDGDEREQFDVFCGAADR